MKLGIILHKVPSSNIFIVDVGWGQLRYFVSNRNYNEGNLILYEKESLIDEEKDDEFYETREAWLKGKNSQKPFEFNKNKISDICRFDECEFLGNVRFDFHHPRFEKSNIVIARKDTFLYWEGYSTEEYISHGPAQCFDLVGNSLLFSSYAEPRYPFPDEKEWMKAYAYAKKKVEELDIPQMIDELKVEFHNHSWTRRGSDNVLCSHSEVLYCYEYHYSYLHDHYLDSIFPQYKESLYSSEDGECEYIHPLFKPLEIQRRADGSVEIKNPQFDGWDIEDYCVIKTKELRQQALKNYESYNKDEHINYLAYHHINWHNINEENKLFQKMNVLGEIIWGFNHHKLLEQITQDNYQELIQNNNSNHPIPQLPDNKMNRAHLIKIDNQID